MLHYEILLVLFDKHIQLNFHKNLDWMEYSFSHGLVEVNGVGIKTALCRLVNAISKRNSPKYKISECPHSIFITDLCFSWKSGLLLSGFWVLFIGLSFAYASITYLAGIRFSSSSLVCYSWVWCLTRFPDQRGIGGPVDGMCLQKYGGAPRCRGVLISKSNDHNTPEWREICLLGFHNSVFSCRRESHIQKGTKLPRYVCRLVCPVNCGIQAFYGGLLKLCLCYVRGPRVSHSDRTRSWRHLLYHWESVLGDQHHT